MDATATAINALFDDHGISASITRSVTGPATTRYDVTLGKGVRVEAVLALAKTLQYTVGDEHVRLLAPVPGRSAVGIEVPNDSRRIVTLEDFDFGDSHPLTIPIGVDANNQPVYGCLALLPHLLVGGTTGSGKSVWLNTLLNTLIERCDPNVLRLVLIDPKRVELAPYHEVPHLWTPVVTEARDAVTVLAELVAEMERRYGLLADVGVRNIAAYNTKVDDEDALPFIVVVIDELADLMKTAPKAIESHVARLTQLARAAGIHLVVATQKPLATIVTSIIKSNIPSRLAFACQSHHDSLVMLDQTGAQNLLGMGDALYLPIGATKPIRVQGAYVGDDAIDAVVEQAQELYPDTEMVYEIEVTEEAEPKKASAPKSDVPTKRPAPEKAKKEKEKEDKPSTKSGIRRLLIAAAIIAMFILGAAANVQQHGGQTHIMPPTPSDPFATIQLTPTP